MNQDIILLSITDDELNRMVAEIFDIAKEYYDEKKAQKIKDLILSYRGVGV